MRQASICVNYILLNISAPNLYASKNAYFHLNTTKNTTLFRSVAIILTKENKILKLI